MQDSDSDSDSKNDVDSDLADSVKKSHGGIQVDDTEGPDSEY